MAVKPAEKKNAEPREPIEPPPPAPPATHRCKVCDARWTLNPPSASQPDGSWSLVFGQTAGKCCDNVPMGDQIEPLPVEPKADREPTPTPLDPRIKVWEDEGALAYHNGLTMDANPHSRDARVNEVGPNHPVRCWARGYIGARKKAEPGWTGNEPSEASSVDPQVEAALRDASTLTLATINTLYNRTLRQYNTSVENAERLKRTLTRLEIVARSKQHEADLARPAALADGTAIKVID